MSKFKLSEYGGRGVQIALISHSYPGPDTVYWSPQRWREEKDRDGRVRTEPAGGFNSFVIVKDEKYGQWLTKDGVKVSLVSINGIGEIRWKVDSYSPHYAEGADKHFELTPLDRDGNPRSVSNE